ncbi:MAG: hypothetical protein ACAI38_04315 [Myxococcota bacterium]
MTRVQQSIYVAPIQASGVSQAKPAKRVSFESPWPARSQRGSASGELVLNLVAATMLGAGVALFASPVAAVITGLAAFGIFSMASQR